MFLPLVDIHNVDATSQKVVCYCYCSFQPRTAFDDYRKRFKHGVNLSRVSAVQFPLPFDFPLPLFPCRYSGGRISRSSAWHCWNGGCLLPGSETNPSPRRDTPTSVAHRRTFRTIQVRIARAAQIDPLLISLLFRQRLTSTPTASPGG